MTARRFTLALVGLALVVSMVTPALAQRVDIESRPPELPIDVVPPALDPVTRPSDADFYPGGPRVQHDPAFIEPLAAETDGGDVGLSGWTAPQTPVGPAVLGQREVNGWLAIGLSITWGGPPAARPALRR
ncbi:MAG: hypothetical protein HYU51_11500 [Candidatus Rokubacteria bacterium]|nr:hypothetical protein [Candidatus Rokubacteria bacterium]